MAVKKITETERYAPKDVQIKKKLGGGVLKELVVRVKPSGEVIEYALERQQGQMMATKKISIDDFRNDPDLSAHVARGREVARALDANVPKLPYAVTFTSLEFVAFVSEMTPKRVELLRAAVKKSRSISELAVAVHREQSAVSKDVTRLAKLGLVKVQEVANAGHGRKKIVVPVAESISIRANFAMP